MVDNGGGGEGGGGDGGRGGGVVGGGGGGGGGEGARVAGGGRKGSPETRTYRMLHRVFTAGLKGFYNTVEVRWDISDKMLPYVYRRHGT